MRNELRYKAGQRETFTGIFVRLGKKRAFRGPDLKTVLLKEVRDATGRTVTNHLWFNWTKGFERAWPLREGDVIQFDARVQRYTKGYQGRRENVYRPAETDYKLSRPTKIKRVEC